MSSQQGDLTPRHVAIVMDGNGRWAKQRMMPRLLGHQRGVETARKVIRACKKSGVECLTLFAFSSENWKRPADEVSGLMKLFMTALDREADALIRHDIRLRFIGERSAFSESLRAKINQVEQRTAACQSMQLLIAANYGGRWDILQAMQAFIDSGQAVAELSEERLEAYLSTRAVPELDLFIRTGGEQRISNFLLWQMAYAELYFSDKLWPAFDEQELQLAFTDFSRRQRRFGMTGEQVEEPDNA